ncbi:MAG: C-terminal helicase domain-containing protein [Gloeomargaritales cyanobacterium]
MSGSVLYCRNPNRGMEMVGIPRIELGSDVKKNGMKWTRRQFPVKPGFAMTINKSQGQTIPGRVGVCLKNSVFCHGQLYVAASRATHPENIRFLTANNTSTRNVVLKQVLR